jgi:hypothetical protein
MPAYQLAYSVESCIQNDSDLVLTYQDRPIRLLFSKKQKETAFVDAQIVVEGNNCNEALALASESLLPPVLDALSFSTNTPLLLIDCKLVLKSEVGCGRRKALYISQSSVPTPVALSKETALAAQSILSAASQPVLPLCWQRYASHRELALDRFLFQWLAFEGLAGMRNVEVSCPKCGNVRTHAGSDKDKAFSILSASDPTTTRADFNRRIWGDARNAVFHGAGYPDPRHLAELVQLSERLRKACHGDLSKRHGLTGTYRPLQGGEQMRRLHLFVEWQTSEPDAAYAADFPEESVAKLCENYRLGDLGIKASSAESVG